MIDTQNGDGYGNGREEDQRDQWGRYPGDPWYGIPPDAPTGPVPYAPGRNETTDPPPVVPGPQKNPDPAPTTDTTTPPVSNLGPFTGTFNRPVSRPMPTLPQVPGAPIPDLPTFEKGPAWKAPSVDEAMADPSYQWRKSQGEKSLQGWAAARGTLNDSGTANALMDYGQNAASQEYQNIWNREWTGYNTNYQTQHVDPYKFKYQTAIDQHTPKMAQWQAGVDMSRLGYGTESAAVQHLNDMDYGNEWARFLQDWTMWRDNRDTGIGLAGS